MPVLPRCLFYVVTTNGRSPLQNQPRLRGDRAALRMQHRFFILQKGNCRCAARNTGDKSDRPQTIYSDSAVSSPLSIIARTTNSIVARSLKT